MNLGDAVQPIPGSLGSVLGCLGANTVLAAYLPHVHFQGVTADRPKLEWPGALKDHRMQLTSLRDLF